MDRPFWRLVRLDLETGEAEYHFRRCRIGGSSFRPYFRLVVSPESGDAITIGHGDFITELRDKALPIAARPSIEWLVFFGRKLVDTPLNRRHLSGLKSIVSQL